MNRYIVHLQQPSGCYYTIGCGEHLVLLNARNHQDANHEIAAWFDPDGDNYHPTFATEVDQITVYVFSESFPLLPRTIRQAVEARAVAREQAEAEQRERAEYERLKAKYG